MFDLEIINQDSFLDLPMEAKALYFLLGMNADDEGFVSPRKILRLYGGTDDSVRLLIGKEFIIPFKSGVVVITDWKRNNYLDRNRIKETIYLEEKSQLLYNEKSEKYELTTSSLTNVKQMLNQNSIEENSIDIYRDKKLQENEEESGQRVDKFPPKIEIKKDIDIELIKEDNDEDKKGTKCLTEYRDKSIEYRDKNVDKEIYSSAKAEQCILYKEIIDYLNSKTGASYKYTTKKTKDLIKARFNEGFTLENFKTVIDKKSAEWINDENMSKYLRPETLFGTKFEGYLNQNDGFKQSSKKTKRYL